MKKIGLIGGISWVSTIDYYKYINEGINERLGKLNYAECLIYSFNYQDIKNNNDAGDWEKTFVMISKASHSLRSSGAEAIILCANTMHLIAEKLQNEIQIPVIHIAEATGKEIKKQQLRKVGLLGTKFTMEMDFFTDKLKDLGIECIIPDEGGRNFVHHTIFEEFGRGIFTAQTKKAYLDIISELETQGAEGIILGCTEIPLLLKPEDVSIPLFDTTKIHANEAVEFMLHN